MRALDESDTSAEPGSARSGYQTCRAGPDDHHITNLFFLA